MTSTNILIRCDEAEKEAIKEKASAMNKSVTDYLLDLAAIDANFTRVIRNDGKPKTYQVPLSAFEHHSEYFPGIGGGVEQEWIAEVPIRKMSDTEIKDFKLTLERNPDDDDMVYLAVHADEKGKQLTYAALHVGPMLIGSIDLRQIEVVND